jgi:hypothetical protein
MMKTVYLRIFSCLLLAVLPGWLFAADQPTAMLYSHGNALLNGTTLPRSSAIFSGDLVQTNKDSVANINAPGSSVLILNDSLVQYEGNSVSLEHGGVSVSTSKSLATRAGDLTVSPAAGAWTEFEVRDVDGTIRIVARKGDLTLSDGAGTTTLPQGQETTREETRQGKKRAPGGAIPGAAGGVLDSPVAIGIGTGAILGVTAWALIQSDNPASPAK